MIKATEVGGHWHWQRRALRQAVRPSWPESTTVHLQANLEHVQCLGNWKSFSVSALVLSSDRLAARSGQAISQIPLAEGQARFINIQGALLTRISPARCRCSGSSVWA